ncbi:hypothetical protein LJR039_003496 [Pseudorhodoferax sp. LjRoot39]|uniref:hypothetical protein n=1 Tax=Pseudorhodoferax sp. LjRoot39 TaxID=3342328 RepID=UPI003ECD5E12
MSDTTQDKDHYFAQLARIADEMTAAYGRDFAMGALVLAARFIAESEARGAATTPEIPTTVTT